MLMNDAIDRAVHEKVWAVVGASNDRNKFGNRIYRDLRAAGYQVYPVHPTETTVEGDAAYARLQDLPVKPVVVDMVVPARIGAGIVGDAVDVGATYFWLQPGAESDALIEQASDAGLAVIHNRCAMVEKIIWNKEEAGSS
ncbi:MAG: CoA-binding protein [Thermomicrobiales bacterium]